MRERLAVRAGPESLRILAPSRFTSPHVGTEQSHRTGADRLSVGEVTVSADMQSVGGQSGAGVVADPRSVGVYLAADAGVEQCTAPFWLEPITLNPWPRSRAWSTCSPSACRAGPEPLRIVAPVRASGARRESIKGGLRLHLSAELAGQVAELAAAAQRCCAFFDFTVRLAGPGLELEVRAPAEAAPLLAEVFGTAG
jgi:hypothetical protein